MKEELDFLNSHGSVLSRLDIKRAIDSEYLGIKAPCPLDIQPASLELHLARTVAFISRSRVRDSAIDLKMPVEDMMDYEIIDPVKGLTIHPREFWLGVTREWFHFPAQLIGNLDGKSSLGRLGFVVHATAGFFDPGFTGHGTLEITNLTERPITVYPNIPVGQMRFTVLSSPTDVLYGDAQMGSKQYNNPYTEDPRPKASEYYKNFQNGKIT
jgi:dCTP deaminase